LYEEVWRRHLIPMRDARIASIENVMSQSEGQPRLEEVLRAFADTFVGPMIEKSARQLGILMAREWIDRRLPANMFLDDVVRPTMTAMQKALVKACPGLDESKVPLVVLSLTGQLTHIVHVKAILQEHGEANLPIFDLAEAIDHIVTFSAAGIRVYAEEKTE